MTYAYLLIDILLFINNKSPIVPHGKSYEEQSGYIFVKNLMLQAFLFFSYILATKTIF